MTQTRAEAISAESLAYVIPDHSDEYPDTHNESRRIPENPPPPLPPSPATD